MVDFINNSENALAGLKKRLLFIITQSEYGGAQKFLSQLINNLEPEKFECAIVTGSEGNREIKNLLPQNVKYIISKHLRRNPSFFSDIASLFELKKIIKKFRPDTLFLNSSKAGFIGSLAAKLLETKNYKLKTIYRVGGWTFNDPWSWHKRLVYRLLEKISAPWKDYIIVNNKHDYDQALKYNIKPRKEIFLIYNGIDPYKLKFLDKDEAKIRLYELLPKKQGSFLHEGLTIGTIANFYPTKGLQYLIEALKLVTGYLGSSAVADSRLGQLLATKLVIIGDGPEYENLKSQILNLKLENKVFLTSRIMDAYKYLKAFDIFVLPSIKEGFPWVLLEAMSAKLPIITTAVGANPEIIENEKNGFLVPSHDPQALAKAIIKLVENEPLRRELGIQAHQTVIHNFPLRKIISQIETIL